MKTLAKEMWHLLVFAAAFITFNAGLTVLFDSWVEWLNDDLSLKSALFLTVVQVGLGLLALKTFEWLHKHVAETRGMKYFKAAVEKHGEALRAEQKKIEEKLLEFAKDNDRLTAENKALNLHIEAANNQIANMIDDRMRPKVVTEHFDDWALTEFVEALRAKLTLKREQGRAGWNDCRLDILQDMLVAEVESLNVKNMDLIDVGNYAMMCWARDNLKVECAQASVMPTRDREVLVD